MRSRWFHKPTLHTADAGVEKRATWLELFFDLVFVAAFIQLGNGLSKNVTVVGFLGFAAIFTPLWVAWTGFTFFVNRFTIDDIPHRLIVIVQMVTVGAMAMTAPDVLEGEHFGFSVSYGTAQLLVALHYLRAFKQVEGGRGYSRYWGSVFALGGIIWLIAAAVPTPAAYGLWAFGVAIIFVSPFSKHSRALNEEQPLDDEHLSERYGILTIIVLGETFVKALSSLTGSGQDPWTLVQATVVVVITASLWWIYFDDVAGARIRRRRFASILWLYGHLPLQIAITAAGVGMSKAVFFSLDQPAPLAYRWLFAGTLGLVMFAVAAIDSVTERRQAELSDAWRVRVRVFTAIMFLLLAAAGDVLDGGVFVALCAALCVVQVAFDMMMAPEAETRESHALPTIAERLRAGEEVPRPRPVAEAVRKGTPSELRRDIYFYLMEGSWGRVLGAFTVLFLLLNVFFAALYTLEPGCIEGARPTSFADAFHFSIQTVSTIGYGAMNPATSYGHTIVAIEAAVGLFLVALATGLMFAKASRPRASVLFSRPLVVSDYNGAPHLIFRVGNARGNEVVDASITLSALVDEMTPEGQHLRRVHDLELVRSRTPVFSLSWVVMHPINESSPLYGAEWDADDCNVLLLIVTMTGHDGTYNETIYARHNYDVSDVRVGHRFVDVISQLADGRLLVDYERFHDTEEA